MVKIFFLSLVTINRGCMKISLKKFFILLPAIFFAAQLYAQKTIGPFDVFVSAQNKKPDTLATGTKQGSADEGRYIDIGISNIKGPIKISPTQFTLQGPPCPTYSNGKRTPATPPPPATKTFGGAVLTDKANIPAPGTTAPAEFTAKDNGYWTKCSTGKKTPYDTTVIVKLNVVSIKILLDKHVAGVCQYNRGLIDVKSKYPDQGGAIKWTSRTGNCKIDEIWNGMRCAFEFTKGNSDVLVCTYTVGKASYYDSCVIKKGDLKWVKDTFRFWAIRGDSVDCKPLVTTSGNINNVKFKSFAGLGRANGMNRKTGKLDANFGESFIVEAEDTTMPGCTATALFEFYSLKIKADDANKCDGLPAAFHLEMKPHDHASMWAQVTNVTFTSATSVPSKGNPGNKTKLDFEAYNAAAHTCKVKNMWWYSTAANNCNDLSTWIISGTASGGGKAVPIAPDNISADAGGTCDNGSASVTQTFTGEPTIDTTYNETTRKW